MPPSSQIEEWGLGLVAVQLQGLQIHYFLTIEINACLLEFPGFWDKPTKLLCNKYGLTVLFPKERKQKQ